VFAEARWQLLPNISINSAHEAFNAKENEMTMMMVMMLMELQRC